MLVAELIEDTHWRPGTGYGASRPRLSVLLPTFRRGADGTFLQAAGSVLAQSERDLELIVVDDGSTDGTADQIDALMRADGRVSCLRHPANIGLPAVSEYEALRRARAPYLAFAFDDFLFEPDALGRLLEAAERRRGAVVHGTVELHDASGAVVRLGAAPASWERLAVGNVLGNAGVVVPRAVVDDVGFYDPHVAAARMCDWDLWRRIVRDYPILREDVLVGRELGTLRADSIGWTYPMYWEAVQEYFNRPRNTALRPENFERFDVWSVPPESTACLAEHVLAMRRFLGSKAWAAGLDVASEDDGRTLLAPRGRCVAVVAQMHAGVPLCFEGLADRYRQSLLYVGLPLDDADVERVLARSDAVILVRQLLEDEARRVARACRRMAIPIYYLTDDNFMLLAEEGWAAFRAYTRQAVAEALAGFAGVLCTSSALAEYFRALPLGPPVDEMRPVFDAVKLGKLRRLAAGREPGALRVGFVGGPHRGPNLREQVVPALAAVARDVPLVFVTRVIPDTADAPGWPFATTAVPSTDFDEFLTRWGEAGLDVLVHPRGDTGNTEYKTSSILLSALYLGAVPIVTCEPPFRDVGEADGVLKVEGDAASWERALRRAQAPEVRRELLSRLDVFCRSHFAPERNERALERILGASAPTDLAAWAWRIRQARQSRAEDLVRAEGQARARAAEVARLEHEAAERERRVSQLEGAAAELAARVRQLEHEAGGRPARPAWLAHPFGLKVVELVRRLAAPR
jgi:glycosyltransferase involved in cell wall biosynthesis